jgi:hypothetical protein
VKHWEAHVEDKTYKIDNHWRQRDALKDFPLRTVGCRIARITRIEKWEKLPELPRRTAAILVTLADAPKKSDKRFGPRFPEVIAKRPKTRAKRTPTV